jgi:hypothetical protein
MSHFDQYNAALFSINDGIQSGPVALWGFRSFSNLNTPFVLITMSFMDGYLLCHLSDIVLVFSFVYTDGFLFRSEFFFPTTQ